MTGIVVDTSLRELNRLSRQFYGKPMQSGDVLVEIRYRYKNKKPVRAVHRRIKHKVFVQLKKAGVLSAQYRTDFLFTDAKGDKDNILIAVHGCRS